MAQLDVETSVNKYPIHILENIRHQFNQYVSKDYSAIFIVTDERVANLYLEDVKESLASHPKVFHTVIPAGEQSKSIEAYYQLQTQAIEYGLDRQSLIIALGGGVVGDLAGFVAATFMRGIDYIQAPTTILAHDSSVGGKVAINHALGKNLIGNFYPPVAVIYDIQTLQSLPAKEIRSGYAEIVKEALIADKELFEDVMQEKLNQVTNASLRDHIFRGIKIKTHFVQEDEKEKGIRAFLNFGHTLGHALESEYGYGTLTHGEAVAIGMLFAMDVSNAVFSNCLPVETLRKWLNLNSYPLVLDEINSEKLLSRMKSDKKVSNNHVQMVLLKEIGNPVLVELNDEDIQKHLENFINKMMKN
ncbi:3-dehydroquinate synthase [Virgibacillus necropolis]|uniref:3-dehydroquinate synthase n=1 Tax=Virgibacillus necropolis TaxID=163877 RepID=A0A221MID2_9BACI|nr:3-dehydroquinate synthase [Virgibacillus necropolis]ASN07369.1 3-dehydroquinate synthase [Virgibacillus necropolis]